MVATVNVGHRLKELRHRAFLNLTGTAHDRDHLLALKALTRRPRRRSPHCTPPVNPAPPGAVTCDNLRLRNAH